MLGIPFWNVIFPFTADAQTGNARKLLSEWIHREVLRALIPFSVPRSDFFLSAWQSRGNAAGYDAGYEGGASGGVDAFSSWCVLFLNISLPFSDISLSFLT